jgi:hypothetical protein
VSTPYDPSGYPGQGGLPPKSALSWILPGVGGGAVLAAVLMSSTETRSRKACDGFCPTTTGGMFKQ